MKPGYKQTEVGVIPEEWEVVTASEACELVVDCKNRTPPVVADSDYAVVRTPNVRDGKFVLEELRFTDAVSYCEWTARAVPQSGDIMITREAPLGEVCEVPPNRKVCLGQRMMLYRPAPAKTASNYLLFALMSEPVRANLLRKIGGSTVGHAKVDDIRFLQLPHPPLPEQRAIATALSDVDGLLGALDRLIAKKRDLKQATMQQLLTGQTRLPGFKGEWVVKRLGDVGTISGSGVDKKLRPDETPVRLVNYMDAYRKDFIFSKDLDHWVTAPPHQLRRCAVQKGDVFFTPSSETRNDIANSAVAMEDIPGGAYSYHIVRLRLTEPWDLHFRAYAFKTKAFFDQAETICDGGGTRYVISQSKFRTMTVLVPPIPEQTAIASVLSEMDAELVGLEQRREKTRALKQGMMQELLTGRTRLV